MQRTPVLAIFLLGLACVAAAEPPRSAAPLQLDLVFEDRFGADPQALERRTEWISESDLVVALYVQEQTRLTLDAIVGRRRAGTSWDTITRQAGQSSKLYYVELPAGLELPRPYARPYAAWRAQSDADPRLSDDEVRELVLLRTLRDYCRLPAGEIVRLRASGQSPRRIAAAHGPRRAEDTVQPMPRPGQP